MRRVHEEGGSALIVVLAVSGLLSLLVTTSFAVARRSIAVADQEEESHAALAAAEAGIDDYMFRLNTEDQYWEHDAADPDGNLAFTQFVPIPGGQSDTDAEGVGMFTYTVDTSLLETQGTILLTSTGCDPGPCAVAGPTSAQRFRTVQVTLKQESFVDYLYFTDFETLPPLVYGSASSIAWAEANCSRHKWDPGGRHGSCVDIFWGGNDRLDGPFHTNDRFQINGNAVWREVATSSDPRTPPYDRSGGAQPTFEGGLSYRRPLRMPPSNNQIRVEADPALGGRGCLFTGPTEIILRGNGTMDVRSPHSRVTGCSASFSGSTSQVRNIPVPANGVVFVQALPTSTSDPNYRASCVSGSGNRLGYPISGDITVSSGLNQTGTRYDCRAGDAFVEGTLAGRLTIASQNSLVITWHLDYQSGTSSMLGLVANDFVQVYHPVDEDNRNLAAGPNHPSQRLTDVRINAAVLSVNGSFMVQNWALGRSGGGGCDRLGDIELNGAIAQIFRGPVGTGGGSGGVCTGYDKDYRYDSRLRFSSPPSFIDPLEATWGVTRYAEQY